MVGKYERNKYLFLDKNKKGKEESFPLSDKFVRFY